MYRTPPETTNASVLLFESGSNSLVASMYFRGSACSMQQSPNGRISNPLILRRCVCSCIMPNHLHNTRTLLLLCPMQHRYIGQTAPHTAFSCGEQVPDVAIPHYKDARMQHSPMQCPSYTAPRVGKWCGLSRSRSA